MNARPKVKILQRIKTGAAYAGAFLSASAFLLSLVLGAYESRFHDQRYWPVVNYSLIVLIFLLIPQRWQLKDEDYELKRIVSPSWFLNRLSRYVAGAILLFGIGRAMLYATRDLRSDDAYVYELALTVNVLVSWLLLACHIFGVRVFFSERILAISRHPIFLFRQKWLRRYLRRRARDAEATANPDRAPKT